MMNERLSRVKTGAIDETRKLFWIFLYLFVLLSLFSFYKALVLNEETLIYHQGFALINALALAKVMLVGEYLHVGDNFKNRPLIFPIIFKSAVFAVLLVCFHIIEESFIEVLPGKTLSQSVPSIGGGKLRAVQRSIVSPLSNGVEEFEAQRRTKDSLGRKSLNLCEATESFGGCLEVIRTFPLAARNNPRSAARRRQTLPTAACPAVFHFRDCERCQLVSRHPHLHQGPSATAEQSL